LIVKEPSLGVGSLSAIDVLFSDCPKSLDLIFIYLPGLIISTRNPRFLRHASIEDKQVKALTWLFGRRDLGKMRTSSRNFDFTFL
jgi:hypothetical protein